MKPVFSLLGGVTISLALGWILLWVLDASYGYEDGRVLTGWSYVEREASAQPQYLNRLQSRKSDVAIRDSSGAEETGPGRLLDFGPLSLKLGMQLPSAEKDRAEAGVRVCAEGRHKRDLTFQYYSTQSEARFARRFKLLVLVDGQERWSAFYPSGTLPTRVVIGDVLQPGKCSSIGFMVMPLDSSQGDSWETASQVEIFYPRLIPADSYDSLLGAEHH